MNYFFVFLLFIGLTLDLLTVIWSYQTSKQQKYKSGNFLVPAILYLLFVFNIDLDFISNNKWLISIFMVFFHLFIYFLLPIVFDKFVKENYGK